MSIIIYSKLIYIFWLKFYLVILIMFWKIIYSKLNLLIIFDLFPNLNFKI